MRTATVALLIRYESDSPRLEEILSDDYEIAVVAQSLDNGEKDPLSKIVSHRQGRAREDEEFSEYVEELVCQPFLKREIQEHGVQWLRSKIRIEKYQKTESEAAHVIADYAYRLYCENSALKDFLLNGPTTQVRVRIFVLPPARVAAEAA